MAGMGPAPKPANQRARRNATVAMTSLPSEGRQGPPPRWPLPADLRLRAEQAVARARIREILVKIDDCRDGRKAAALNKELGKVQERVALITQQLRLQREAELALWTELWATPQAAQWERMRWTREVASYVRYRVMGELGDLDQAKEARQWSDRLGLSPLAMLRLRWQVVPDELAARRDQRTEPDPATRPAGEDDDPLAALRAV